MTKNKIFVYAASHTDQPGEGISWYRLAQNSGALTFIGKTSLVNRVLYLTHHPHQAILYAVSDVAPIGESDEPTGLISAFAIDQTTGQLTLLNQQPTGGTTPCFVSLDQTGQMAVVAHFRGPGDLGSLAVLPLLADGQVGAIRQLLTHKGRSVHPTRQRCSHVHAAIFDKDNAHVIVADLGRDKLIIYRCDPAAGQISKRPIAEIDVEARTGPRHLTFHPDGHILYLINEISNTVKSFAYEAATGRLREQQTVSILPTDFAGQSSCAHIHVHPAGRFVYGSNRGHDSLAIFGVAPQSGELTLLAHTPTLGQTPRGFALDPGGKFLLVANQNSQQIVTFQIDSQTGHLASTGFLVEVASPVCLSLYSTAISNGDSL